MRQRICPTLFVACSLAGCLGAEAPGSRPETSNQNVGSSFEGARPGEERQVAGTKLCWCPPGRFIMGSPRSEPERRPDEDQVEVTLSRGFWMAKYEATQGEW